MTSINVIADCDINLNDDCTIYSWTLDCCTMLIICAMTHLRALMNMAPDELLIGLFLEDKWVVEFVRFMV